MTWRLRPVLVPLSASNLWTCSISAYKSVVGYTYVHSTTTEVEALVKPSIAFSLVSVTYNPPLQYVIYHEYLCIYFWYVHSSGGTRGGKHGIVGLSLGQSVRCLPFSTRQSLLRGSLRIQHDTWSHTHAIYWPDHTPKCDGDQRQNSHVSMCGTRCGQGCGNPHFLSAT